MGQRLVHLMSKDIGAEHTGDIALWGVQRTIAAELGYDQHSVALSPRAAELGSEPGLTRVPKPAPRPLPLLVRSLRSRHSLVHTRFDLDAVVDALNTLDPPDAVLAHHSYMAEAFLRSRLAGRTRLLVDADVSEAVVWAQTRGLLGRVESRRITADEARVARAADALAVYDRDEANRRLGAHWLELTMPPAAPVDVAATAPVLGYLGHGDWPPNRRAAQRLLDWWPRIRDGVDGAELWLMGYAAGRPLSSDPTVRELGFVDDLDGRLAHCRALAAPVDVGGGVRVKVLHAVSRGLPVITTRAGLGSLDEIFGTTPYDKPAEFIARCRTLLLDAAAAAEEGARSYQANVAHWGSGRPAQSLADFLTA